MDVGNVGMVQGRQRLRFARESCEPVRIVGERIREGFECDIAIQLRVASPVYQTHSALANLRGDFVDAEARADGEAQALLVEYTPPALLPPAVALSIGRIRMNASAAWIWPS